MQSSPPLSAPDRPETPHSPGLKRTEERVIAAMLEHKTVTDVAKAAFDAPFVLGEGGTRGQ